MSSELQTKHDLKALYYVLVQTILQPAVNITLVYVSKALAATITTLQCYCLLLAEPLQILVYLDIVMRFS